MLWQSWLSRLDNHPDPYLFAVSSHMHGRVNNLCVLHMQNPGLPIQKLQDIQRAMELLSCQGPAKSIDEATKHKYQFWDTQPVPKLSEWQEKLFLFGWGEEAVLRRSIAFKALELN